MDAVVSGPPSESAGAPLAAAFEAWSGLLEALPVGVCVVDATGAVTHMNRRAAEIWGQPPRTDGESDPAPTPFRVYQLDGRRADDSAVNEVLRSGVGARDLASIIERPDGSRLQLQTSIEPLRDAGGEIVGAVSCFQDVSGVVEARRKDARHEGWTRQVFQRSPVAIYWTDAEGFLLSFNAAAERLWGRTPVIGEDRWCGSLRLQHPDGRPMPLDTCPMAIALKTDEAVQGLEAIFERPDGSRGAFLAYPTLLRDACGATMGAVNMLVDISDRKQAEDRQKVLVDELNHRVKNTLASVQSLAAHTLRGSAPPEEMRERFEARLLALSNVHNQLAERHWEDARLEAMIQSVLAPYGMDDRIELEGPAVPISARVAVTLCMVLHELATNAVKHGALSTAEGRLRVAWHVTGDQRLVLDWRESGGARVEPPTQTGFGARFMHGAVTRQLGGRIDHEFEPDGWRCHIEAPL